MTTEPQSLNTRTSGDDGNLGDDDGNLGNDVITVSGHDITGTQPISHSAIQFNPDPHALGEKHDTEKEKKGHVIQSSNGSANALELLMGQYHDSDSELEPGEVL